MGLEDLFRLLGIETEEERERKRRMQQFLAAQEKLIRRRPDGNIDYQGIGGVYSYSFPLTQQDRLQIVP